jgi:hypothetical protein
MAADRDQSPLPFIGAAHPRRSATSSFVAFALKKIVWLRQRTFSLQIGQK